MFVWFQNLKLRFQESENLKKRLFGIFIALAVISTLSATYFYIQVVQLKKNPQRAAQKDAARLVASVSRHILLPKDETPTVATVTDPAPLSNQPFFLNAEKGFKVLIYAQAKKAILYDPFNDKIVEVGPVNIGSTGNK